MARSLSERIATAAIVSAGLWLAACRVAGDARFDGPMPVRNQHPVQQVVLHLDPISAQAPADGEVELRWNTAYANLFLGETRGGDRFEMDGELLRTAVAARVGVGDGLALGIELPFAYGTGGFLDDFVVDWHELIGAPSQGRDTHPRDEFRIEATRGGALAFGVDAGEFALRDVPLSVAWSALPITQARPVGLALRAAVELPTGDSAAGFGNGEVDWAIGATGEARLSNCSLTGWLQHAFAGTPGRARRAGLGFADVTSFGLGAELSLGPHWSLLAQSEYENSALRRLPIDIASDDQWLLWVGARARLGGGASAEVGFGEDLISYVAPDFVAWVSLRWAFGGSAQSGPSGQ